MSLIDILQTVGSRINAVNTTEFGMLTARHTFSWTVNKVETEQCSVLFSVLTKSKLLSVLQLQHR